MAQKFLGPVLHSITLFMSVELTRARSALAARDKPQLGVYFYRPEAAV